MLRHCHKQTTGGGAQGNSMSHQNLMPQQQLLLELMVMSGDIAVTDLGDGSLLRRTLEECANRGWIEIATISQGFSKASITPKGRAAAKLAAGRAA